MVHASINIGNGKIWGVITDRVLTPFRIKTTRYSIQVLNQVQIGGSTLEITKITPEIKELNIINHLKNHKDKIRQITSLVLHAIMSEHFTAKCRQIKSVFSPMATFLVLGLLLAEDFKQVLCKQHSCFGRSNRNVFKIQRAP